nr:hypothetical protein Itr_chr05CG21500 [Ipomoea trifida]GMD02070.1 hypothetical protein Iba_chr05fCG13120 [Ipomoea batatas]
MKSEVKSEPQRHSLNSFCDHHGICPSESRVSGEKAQLGPRLHRRSESSFQLQDSHLNSRYHYISLSESRLSGYSVLQVLEEGDFTIVFSASGAKSPTSEHICPEAVLDDPATSSGLTLATSFCLESFWNL